MSNEHASGSAGPQEGQPSEAHEAVAPAVSDTAAADAPPVVESEPTLAIRKVSEPAAPAAPVGPEAAAAPAAAPEYIDAPPPVPPAPAAPANPYSPPSADSAAPVAPSAPTPSAAFAPSAGQSQGFAAAPPPAADQHHPFGAGHPLGGWAAPADGGGVPYPSELGAYGAPAAPATKKRGGFIALVAAVALVAGLAGGAIGASLADGNGSGPSSSANRNSTTTAVADNQAALNRAPDSVAGIAAKALPSVVTIKAQGSQESGTGAGFIFDTEGHILTNNHVVAPADNGGKLTVKFSDGSSYSASVVGRAKGYDVAVIKLDNPPTDKLIPLPLGDSDKAAVGDTTIAIGAPYGLEGTVTSGIISAKNRPVESGDSQTGAQQSYMNALQTDAPINPGNSGGPLLNASGQVIGINSAIQSNSGGSTGQAGSIGLGFAIPINQAKWVAQTLIQTGTPVYAIIGVLRNPDYTGDGAQIATSPVQGTPPVTAGGPADQAGLKPGDVITKLGGITIDSSPTLVSEIWTHKPGEKVDVEYTRDGKAMKTTVTLGSRSGDS